MINWKEYAISSAITFVSTFALIASASIGSIEWTRAAIASLALTALRAAVKAVFEYLATLKA